MHTYLLVAGDEKVSDLLEPFADYGGEGTNNDAKFDWFEVGGRFGSALRLRSPRPLRKFFGLLPAGLTSCAVSAKKFEIDQQALLADPPAALLYNGNWSESAFFAKSDESEKWRVKFSHLFQEIPDDTTLTVVDCHS